MPTKGTTVIFCNVRLFLRVSIHVPTKGTTAMTVGITTVILFQSTCPRRARPSSLSFICKFESFNPRAHEGHDKVDEELEMVNFWFQSTCPRRARLTTKRWRTRQRSFNPRAHEGHDKELNTTLKRQRVSIHVPTKGTTTVVQYEVKYVEFQSTCPRRARLGQRSH